MEIIKKWLNGQVVEIDLSKVKMSSQRKANLKQAFPQVKWNFGKSRVHIYGLWGDRISFCVPGKLKVFIGEKEVNLEVEYRHRTPAGGPPSMRIFSKGKMIVLGNAPQYLGDKVIWALLSKFKKRFKIQEKIGIAGIV